MREVLINNSVPKMDASSAVYPTARVLGDSLVIAYHLPGCQSSAVIQFNGVTSWAYGYPNDEGLHQHPLWGKGLRYYEFHEVRMAEGSDADWIATFHDGTLTVRAQSIEVLGVQTGLKPWVAIDARFGPGDNQVLDEL